LQFRGGVTIWTRKEGGRRQEKKERGGGIRPGWERWTVRAEGVGTRRATKEIGRKRVNWKKEKKEKKDTLLRRPMKKRGRSGKGSIETMWRKTWKGGYRDKISKMVLSIGQKRGGPSGGKRKKKRKGQRGEIEQLGS